MDREPDMSGMETVDDDVFFAALALAIIVAVLLLIVGYLVIRVVW